MHLNVKVMRCNTLYILFRGEPINVDTLATFLRSVLTRTKLVKVGNFSPPAYRELGIKYGLTKSTIGELGFRDHFIGRVGEGVSEEDRQLAVSDV